MKLTLELGGISLVVQVKRRLQLRVSADYEVFEHALLGLVDQPFLFQVRRRPQTARYAAGPRALHVRHLE